MPLNRRRSERGSTEERHRRSRVSGRLPTYRASAQSAKRNCEPETQAAHSIRIVRYCVNEGNRKKEIEQKGNRKTWWLKLATGRATARVQAGSVATERSRDVLLAGPSGV